MKLLFAKFILPISSDPIENGGILIDQGEIKEVGKSESLLQKYSSIEREDLGETVLMPGLINAHCHLELSLAPKYDPKEFQELNGEPNFIRWLLTMSQYQDNLKPEEKRNAIQKGIDQLIKNGTTTVGDLTTYEGALKLYDQSGLRVVTYPEIMTIHKAVSQDRFESALAMVDEVVGSNHPRIQIGLAPFAPYTVSKNLLKILFQHVKQLQIPIQIHASQSFAEMEFFYDSKGDVANLLFPKAGWGDNLPPPYQKTPIQYLHSIGFLQIRPALVGCVHLGPTDLSQIAESQSSIIHCPKVSETLRLGSAPLLKILHHQIPVGLGTEHLGCNSSLSIWDEMRKVWELKGKAESTLHAKEILKMATLGGAYALGLEKKVGSLEKGKKGDLLAVQVSLDTTLQNLQEQIIQQTTSDQIFKKWIAGKEI